ncbi:MAG: four helix bundle protein [Bacteroidaceae bacterium]|nr:four helix bundle protein [Bacteroidaceae bacterium]
MEKEYFGFQKLNVYKDSRVLVRSIYELLRAYPVEERYALCDQMRRAVISVPSNIAEGMSRSSIKEQIHYLEISYGSLSEIVCQLDISKDLSYIDEIQYDDAMNQCKNLSRMLSHMKTLREQQINIE